MYDIITESLFSWEVQRRYDDFRRRQEKKNVEVIDKELYDEDMVDNLKDFYCVWEESDSDNVIDGTYIFKYLNREIECYLNFVDRKVKVTDEDIEWGY